MLYSTETFKSGLLIDIILFRLEYYIKHWMKNYEKSDALESLSIQIKMLRDELNNSSGLQGCIYKSGDSDVATVEEIKNYLFSILTPKKLQILRNWLLKKESINVNFEYKIDIILHTYLNDLNIDRYDKQPISVSNEISECNIPLEALINLIEKTAISLIRHGGERATIPDVVIAELKILRNELFNSNSTILFTHRSSSYVGEDDEKVKDYLFSMLSSMKVKTLGKWLYDKDSLFTKDGNKLGIITSIYVPDVG